MKELLFHCGAAMFITEIFQAHCWFNWPLLTNYSTFIYAVAISLEIESFKHLNIIILYVLYFFLKNTLHSLQTATRKSLFWKQRSSKQKSLLQEEAVILSIHYRLNSRGFLFPIIIINQCVAYFNIVSED